MDRSIKTVDEYITKAKLWKNEQTELRKLVQNTELVEELKWSQPCYTLNGKNVVMIGAFNESAIISFLKGVLMKDPHNLLEKQGENTAISRILRIRSIEDIEKYKDIIVSYLDEAIEIEKSGVKIEKSKPKEIVYPSELIKIFDENKGLKEAFEKLTPGRQRAYIIHFDSAKQSATKESRIIKYIPKIMAGKGMNDWK
jgi:uncharacterized protein YdeI (YjbR/CyaY-like superfamily)